MRAPLPSFTERVRLCRELPLPLAPVAALARYDDPYGLVDQGLRQWFEVLVREPRWPLGLPSLAVTVAWTAMAEGEDYADFCLAVYGRAVPVEVDRTRVGPTYFAACRSEGIDARHPPYLPVLFLVDQTLRVAGGFTYDSRCSGRVCRVELPAVCVRHAFMPGRFWSTYVRDAIDPNPS